MTVLLAGFDTSAPGQDSGPFVAAPERLVLHTTEGASAAGAIAAYRSTGSWPHFTVDAGRRIRYQHISLDLAARALVHTGAVETNREGAIQIEMVGFAAQTPTWTDDALQWLATEVIAPILKVTGITTDHPAFIGTDGHPSGVNAKQRFTDAQWAAFHGICGHQHVPSGNDHWDPGGFPIDRLIAFMEDDMPLSKSDLDAVAAAVWGQAIDLSDGSKQPAWAVQRFVQQDAHTAAAMASKAAGEHVDPAQIAAAVLAGLDPKAIAAAIPGDLAKQVADELHNRLAG